VPEEISRASTVRISGDIVFRKLEGEAVILHLATGTYYGLDAVGTRIWELLREQARVDAIMEAILQQYEVEPARCEQDLLGLLRQLHAKGLIEIVAGTRHDAS
jgi:hypothetical protein